ncbi:MAG: molybdopterin-dependent oxidoreductase [Candidatus Cloacimonetes bacterium]|nr:molybdopterin-dependent oxidoreductase [Candidatus Cloacimonadota bacterium]
MLETVGKRVIRIDGPEKASGKAVYGDDIRLPGLLYAACRYSDIPAGKIMNLDISALAGMTGVKAVATFSDIPGQSRLGPIRKDQYALVDREIFFHGDVLAVVAAEDKRQALEAVNSIIVDYEPYEPVCDPEKALLSSTRLIHPDFKSNLVVHYPLIKGDIERGFAESDHILEREYRTGFVEHAYLEPESVVAVPDPVTAGYKIFGSIQNPYTTRRAVAEFMGLRLNQINVCSSTLGGSFGGKDDIVNMMACRVALLAKLTGKPVKLTNTRENSIRESYKRHPYIMKYKTGFTQDGRIKAMQIDILADSGAYSSQSFFVTWRSVVQATGPYEIENVKTDIRAVYSNNCYTAAFRGFGSPQVIFAQESLMDEIAELCYLSPLEIRQINGYRQGSITASGQVLQDHQVSLLQVIKEAAAKADFLNKYKKFRQMNNENTRYRYGIGLACSFRGCALGAEGTDATSAIVSVQADGSVYVIAGLNENGQGLRTTFCQIAAEVLGIPLPRIVFVEPQTATIADGGPTVASRSTLMGGNAVQEAAEKIKKTMFSVIMDFLNTDNLSETIWQKDTITGPDGKQLKFREAVELTLKAGYNLSAYGWYKAPKVNWQEDTGQGNAYFTYVYGCQVAELKVDTLTGKIQVEKITAAHDAGRIINRIGAEGQVYGGVLQGMGYALMEDLNSQNGEIKAVNFDEYLLPTCQDAVAIEPVLIENPDQYGPFGAKSLGEPTLELTAAAINNAFCLATGKRSYRIPLTLEQSFLGKPLVKPERQSLVKSSNQVIKQTDHLPEIHIESAETISEALQILRDGKYRILAGGTDLLIDLRKKIQPQYLLNIGRINELRDIKKTRQELIIGGGVTFSGLLRDQNIINLFPVLHQACTQIGSLQIRNRATIGGNIVNAAPCADSVPPLILYDASITLTSPSGSRVLRVDEFLERSYRTKILPDEILTAISLPLPRQEYRHFYYQLGRRQAVNITRLSLSGIACFDDQGLIHECRLVDGALFPKPRRLLEIENLLHNSFPTPALIGEIEYILDAIIEKEIGKRWSVAYKKPVFINLVKAAIMELTKRS